MGDPVSDTLHFDDTSWIDVVPIMNEWIKRFWNEWIKGIHQIWHRLSSDHNYVKIWLNFEWMNKTFLVNIKYSPIRACHDSDSLFSETVSHCKGSQVHRRHCSQAVCSQCNPHTNYQNDFRFSKLPNLKRVLGTLFWGCQKFLLGHLTCLATPLLLAAIFENELMLRYLNWGKSFLR